MAPPPLDAPLPSRRSQYSTPSQELLPSASKKPTGSRNVLTKRVLSVDEFRKERQIRARLNPPPPPVPGIPVPLYPGETQQQYNYKFTQWLAKKNESLEALHSDPKRERKLWLTFAFLREQSSTTAEKTRSYKRNLDEEYETFYRRSATQEINRLKRHKSMEGDRNLFQRRSPSPQIEERKAGSSYHSGELPDKEMMPTIRSLSTTRPNDSNDDNLTSFRMPPRQSTLAPKSHSSPSDTDQTLQSRSRTEILAPRVLSVEDYIREMKEPKLKRKDGKLAKIPVPLFTGETMNDYEQEFGRWLHGRQTSVLSLRYTPLKERVYRHQFAQQRSMKNTNTEQYRPQTHFESAQRKENDKHKVSCAVRGETNHDSSKNLHHSSSPSHSFIEKDDDSNYPSWDISQTSHNKSNQKCETIGENNHEVTNPPIHTQGLIKDSQANDSIGTLEVTTAPHSKSTKATVTAEPSTHSFRVSDHDQAKLKLDIPAQDKLPSWVLQLITRVQELETKVADLQREINDCRSSCQCIYSDRHSTPVESVSSSIVQNTVVSTNNENVIGCCSNSKTIEGDIQGRNNADAEPPNNVLSPPLTITKLSKRTEVSTNADIHREATHNLAYSIQSRAQEDSKKRQLTEEYDHLNKQITLNETAIEDALDYIKAIKDVDEAVAMEQHSQIMELVVSINKEKERRVNALTALIIYTFAPKQNILRSLLDEESARVAQEGANHEKLGTIFSQIEEKDSVLETLEMHLNEQLQWVSEIPSDVSEAGKTLRFKALRKLSKRLIKEQTAKKQLECEREDMLKRCIQSDKTIRKSVREFLEVT